MAFRRWNGGATAVAQVKTIQFTTSTAADEVTVTMTAEDGSTQAVTHTVVDSQVNHLAAAIQSACDSSALSLFNQVDFTVSTDTVTVTAKVAGRPFYLEVTDDGTTAYTVADPTASAGPNDWNTAANWSGSAVPIDEDLVNFTDGSFDVLYGLDQSAVELRQLTVASGYRGNIGTATAPLKIDTDPASGSGSESLELAGSGYYYNFEGIYPVVTVTKNNATLKVKGTLSKVSLVGSEVSGNIIIDASGTVTEGCPITVSSVSPACSITIPATATETGHIVQDSGSIALSASAKTNKSSLILSGSGRFTTKDSGVMSGQQGSDIRVLGGLYAHESDADLGGSNPNMIIYGGRVDMTKARASTGAEFLGMGDVQVYGGELDLSAAGTIVSVTSLKKYGGFVRQSSSSLSVSKL